MNFNSTDLKKLHKNAKSDLEIKAIVAERFEKIRFLGRHPEDSKRAFFECNEHGKIEASQLLSKSVTCSISKSRNPCEDCRNEDWEKRLNKKPGERRPRSKKLSTAQIKAKLAERFETISFLRIDPKNLETKKAKKAFFKCSEHGIIKDSKSLFGVIGSKPTNPCSDCRKKQIRKKPVFKNPRTPPSNKITDSEIKAIVAERFDKLSFLRRDPDSEYQKKAFFKCSEHGIIEKSKSLFDVISPTKSIPTNPCLICGRREKEKRQLEKTTKKIQEGLIANGLDLLFFGELDPTNKRNGFFHCKKHGRIDESKDIHARVRKKNPMSCCEKCTSESISKNHGTKLEEAQIQKRSNDIFGHFIFLRRDESINGNGIFMCTKHPKRGKRGEFSQNIQNHFDGHNPCCAKISKGEAVIKNILDHEKIEYQHGKSFKDCRSKSILPFDFYLKSQNLLIEYDGRQHDEFVEYFHRDMNGFEEQKKRDRIKNKFAVSKQIRLLRINIPHTKKKEIKSLILKQLA